MRLRELVDAPQLRLVLRSGAAALERDITGIYTTDLRDPRRYLSAGDVVLTGLMWHSGPADSESFVAALAEREVAAVGAGEAALGSVPADLVAACERHGLPLFAVPTDVSFGAITEYVLGKVTKAGEAGLASVIDRHRRLVATVAEGSGLQAVFGLMASELSIAGWVLSPTGRLVVGTQPAVPAERAAWLASEFLAAPQLPRVATAADGAVYSLFAITTRAEPRVGTWFLACEGDQDSWTHEVREAALELAALVAVERTRLDEGLRVERRIAEQLVRLLVSEGADPAETAARLRACGLSAQESFLVVIASTTDTQQQAETAHRVIEEIIRPVAPRAVIAALADEAVALVPVDPSASGPLVDHVNRSAAALEQGLQDSRLTVGISGTTVGVSAPHGAVEEARHARQLAELRHGRACVVTSDEIDSHVLLLASVPDDVRRSFRSRLLGPLLDYDARHNSDLLDTLDAFLRHSGSWSSCAAELHVHVNTLRYRIQRTEKLTGRNLGRLEDRVDFFLALRAT